MKKVKDMKWRTGKIVLSILFVTVGIGICNTNLEVNAGNRDMDFIEKEDSDKAVGENSEHSYVVVKDGKTYHSSTEGFVKFYMEQEGTGLTEEVFNDNSEEIVEADSASENQCGESLYWELSEDGVMTISGTGKMWDFRNDAEYFDYHECPWKEQKEEIKSVVFEPGISYIGAYAFAECENLTQVTFCDTLKTIGVFAFWSCKNLGNFELPEGLSGIGQQAFGGSEKLTSIVIPDSVTFLDSGICENDINLTYAYIGGNKNVGGYTYSNCPFRNCKSLERIEVSEDNVALCAIDGVLYSKRGMNWQSDFYVVPEESVMLVQYPAGKKDTIYTLADKTFQIDQFAMESAQYLEELVIPDTVLEIGISAISMCPNLEKIIIPSSVKILGDDNGGFCEQLKFIENQSEAKMHLSVNGLSGEEPDKYYRYWKNVETNMLVDELETGVVQPVYLGRIKCSGEYFETEGITYQVLTAIEMPLTVEEINSGKTCGEVFVYDVPQDKADSFLPPDTVEYWGWKYTVSKEESVKVTPTPNVTEAVSTPTYKISYNLKGGTNNKNNPSVYTTKDIKLKAPERKGYTFDGWYINKSYTNQIKTIKASTKQDITVYAKWTKVKKPSKPVIKSVVNIKGKKLKVTLKQKVNKAKGYEISYTTDKKWKKSVKNVTLKGTSKTITKLKKNKTYYVRVRAYKLDSAGEKVYGSYSKVKKVKIQK